ncbi:MAG: GntR family transcriptional regulator [Ruminococcaceae bacterium]|nr:GntR family transcriptional regulator [Oscillospiraceae bacterium]
MSGERSGGSLRAVVFESLERAIIDGEFQPGDSLSEIMLSEKYGVSRTPVREALRQLELEGLVRLVPNKGATVVGVSEKDIDDIYAVRIRIEGLAARLCAENATDEEVQALERLADLQEFYLLKGKPEQLWQLDGEFHNTIFDASRNRPLKSMLSSFHSYVSRARSNSMRSAERAGQSVEEHRAILSAIAAHDGDRAEQLMTAHIIAARSNISSGSANE